MAATYPVRSVLIHGEAARAWMRARAEQRETSISVHDAETAAKALGDDGNEQHCPLCNEFMATAVFVRHAAQCIDLRGRKWRGQRDRDPGFADLSRVGRRLIVFGHDPEGGA